jgi:branched-chain amino acid transport system substrate-binding protein
MRTNLRRGMLVSALAVSLALGAQGAAFGADRSAAPSGTPIKVGVICACTGAFGTTIAVAAKVVEAWEKSVNAKGGINGHPVDVNILDDASTPGNSVTRAQTHISDGVDVILDITTLGSAWAQAVDGAKIPVVGGNLSGIPYYTDANFYPSGQTNDSIVNADVLTAKQAGGKKLAQLYCAEAPQCQESVEAHKKAGDQFKVPLVYSASIAATAPNYTAQCIAAQQAGADAMFIGHSGSVVMKVAADCERQGYKPIYITQGTGFVMSQAPAPGLSDRLWSSYPILPFWGNSAPVKEMNKALNKYSPGTADDANFSEYAAQAWTGGKLIEAAVQKSGIAAADDVTAADITKALDSMKDETLGGWSPPLTFTAGKPHSVDCWYTGRVQKGTPKLVNGGKLTCNKKPAAA